jgi:DNA-binding protein HU-beta
MNKAALVDLIAQRHGITKADAERIIDTIIESIISTLKRGGEVAIAGLGAWKVRDRAARTARNPRTGEIVKVAATKVPKFTAAKALKDSVKG